MPFIGQDWRAPGDAWIKMNDGSWEQIKLRPLRSSINDNSTEGIRLSRAKSGSESSTGEDVVLFHLDEDNDQPLASPILFDELEVIENSPCYQPHCFVKTCKSKEFVGCASISEAFSKLDLTNMIGDVRKFNYICKVVQILVRDKLQSLSASARKILLNLVEAIVFYAVETDCELKTVRSLLSDFMVGLNTGAPSHHCGSPKLLTLHQDTAIELFDLLNDRQIQTPAECAEDCVTFLDLPQECLRTIMRRLPDHASLLPAAQSHDRLDNLVNRECNLWKGLCRFHFTQLQIDNIREKLKKDEKRRSLKQLNGNVVLLNNIENEMCDNLVVPFQLNWRHLYFELKKFFGLKELFAEMIQICCHCKALYWRDPGHPCVSKEPLAPSVRVTPQQFVDMLILM